MRCPPRFGYNRPMRLSVFYHHLRVASEQTGRPLPDILAHARSLGVESVVLDPSDAVPGVLNPLADAGLAVGSVPMWFRFTEDTFDLSYESFVETLRAAGAPQVLIIPSFYRQGEDRSRAFQKVVEGIAAVTRICRAAGIVPTLENFDAPESPCCNPSDVAAILDAVPELGYCLDTGNFAIVDESPLPLCERYAVRVPFIHAKDRLATASYGPRPRTTASGRLLYPGPVGEGEVPFREIFATLRKGGMGDVPVAMEFYDTDRMLDCLDRSAAFLSAI